MDFPPTSVLRLLLLPVKHRQRFGEWLNVVWDDRALVNVLGTSPYTIIDSERRKGCRILYADADRGIKLRGAGAAVPKRISDGISFPAATLSTSLRLKSSRKNSCSIRRRKRRECGRISPV